MEFTSFLFGPFAGATDVSSIANGTQGERCARTRMREHAERVTGYSSASYAALDPDVASESGNLGSLLLEEPLLTAWIADISRVTSGLPYFMEFTSFLSLIPVVDKSS